MTVRCVDKVEKDMIVDLYRIYNVSVTQLAGDFQVSRRTVYRVLAEQGITFSQPEPEPLTFLQKLINAFRRKILFFIPATQ